MTTPQDQQKAPAAPEAPVVRACERCGTGAASGQEWCLGCGARLSPVVDRLPGLRAAAVTVAIAVMLAGGAAAAAYAALSSDATTRAQAPANASGTPVAETAPEAPVPPAVTPPPAVTEEPAPAAEDDITDVEADADDADADADADTDVEPDTDTSPDSDTNSGGKQEEEAPKTPASKALAFGNGSLYDPDGVLAEKGSDGLAIDGKTNTAWTFTLAPEQTGGFGFVLDFDTPTTVSALTVRSTTPGMTVKVLGTTQRDLPPDALDLGWDALSSEEVLNGRKSGTKIALKDAAGRSSRKYRHILVLVTESPTEGEIIELSGRS